MRFNITRRRFLTLLGLSLSLPFIDALIVEPGFIVVKSEVNVSLKNIPEELSGFCIAHISNLHFGSSNNIVYGNAVSIVKSIKPNVIAITGDIVSKSEAEEESLKFIEEISKIAPVFIVWGNWDHWSLGSTLKEFKGEVESLGEVRVLINENIELEKGFYLVGVDDPYIGYDDLSKALNGTFGIRVLLAHSPQIIDRAKGNTDFVLSGHTHGGQIVLPLVGPIFVPLPKKFRNYVSGLYKVGNTTMYVSKGIGTSILPIRFNCPPEIAVFMFSQTLY